MTRWVRALVVAGALPGVAAVAHAQQPPPDTVPAFLRQLEGVVRSGGADAYVNLVAGTANRGRARDFAARELQPGVTRVVIQERERSAFAGLPRSYRLLLDVFTEYGSRARVASWRIEVEQRNEPASPDDWRITDQERIESVENLYRLSLNPSKQYTARDLRISSEDFELTLAEGSVFVADTDRGVTGLVLAGRGTLDFHPAPETERGQLQIFCGAQTLRTPFEAAFIRLNPGEFAARVAADKLVERAVDPRELRRADEVFHEEWTKSFSLDLGDLSRDLWSVVPNSGDFLAEIRTRRFGTLTYARVGAQAEDVNLFDRKHHHNIALYASKERLAARGRFYDEDALADYDVLDYDIDVSLAPDRQWLEGRARMRLSVRASLLGTITLRLANPLVVRSIVSDQFGRLFSVRIRDQESIAVSLPTAVARGTVLTFTVAYSGRLPPQAPDRETLQVQAPPPLPEDRPNALNEPSFLYSNRSLWYPQATVTDYATATVRISIPAQYECIASGDLDPGSPSLVGSRKVYAFSTLQPVRYLSFLVSRFVMAGTSPIGMAPDAHRDGEDALPGVSYEGLNLSVVTNPRQTSRARDFAERAADVAQFYTSILGDYPYPSFTLAIIENDLPGGHSPGYFAALNQPLPMSPVGWRNDPVSFTGYPEFFVAHEIAHQWWGQAVGWRNYHEQWLSEGFAQYFAALYAQHRRGDDAFAGMLRQMRRWGIEESGGGAIYLGYRVGHLRDDPRVFRAVVYNKSAAVLHMLRRLVGDEAFFRGVRRFYRTSRFRKVGTDNFRIAIEAEAGQPLDRFFERWVYGAELPRLKFSYRVEPGVGGQQLVLHIEQVGELFDVPVTITLRYADRKVDVVVPVTERTADMRVALAGPLRGVEVSKDDGTLAEIVK